LVGRGNRKRRGGKHSSPNRGEGKEGLWLGKKKLSQGKFRTRREEVKKTVAGKSWCRGGKAEGKNKGEQKGSRGY